VRTVTVTKAPTSTVVGTAAGVGKVSIAAMTATRTDAIVADWASGRSGSMHMDDRGAVPR
jgi:hypothetical protein